MTKFLKLIKNEKGATAIEYGLIAALIAVAAIGAMTNMGTKLSSTFENVATSLKERLLPFHAQQAAVPKGAAASVLSLFLSRRVGVARGSAAPLLPRQGVGDHAVAH